MTNVEQELKNRIIELERENKELAEVAMRYGTYGDVMRTIALLPLDATTKTTAFRDRVEVALMFHGLNVKSPKVKAIAQAFIEQVIPEREKIVRMFDLIFRQRRDGGLQRMKDGCVCIMCEGARASQKIIESESEIRESVANDPNVQMPLAAMDFPAKKVLENRDIPEMRESIEETEKSLADLFEDLNLLRDPLDGGEVLAMLAEMLGVSDSGGISVFEIGPEGFRKL